ncbi:MAG TPA: VOC family protein [Candidatus Angelobacter sp.]|nr:VOC family protein [Candidatus Angelobacter sp.]
MLRHRPTFSSFSASDIGAMRAFYADTLGLDVTEEDGMLMLDLEGRSRVVVYPKDDHQPATFTVLNFEVDDIDAAVDDLATRGVTFERYEGFSQDERGIMREFGPPIAWFTDPSRNVLALIQTRSTD